MRAVGVMTGTAYKFFEMRVADQVVHELNEMTLLDFRRLFADRDFPWDREPELELMPQPSPAAQRELMWAEDDFYPETEADGDRGGRQRRRGAPPSAG